jgi:serine phosphatase RsbU (regulator of sigma subunit)
VNREKKQRREDRRIRNETRREVEAKERAARVAAGTALEETTAERKVREKLEHTRDIELAKEQDALLPKREELPEGKLINILIINSIIDESM